MSAITHLYPDLKASSQTSDADGRRRRPACRGVRREDASYSELGQQREKLHWNIFMIQLFKLLIAYEMTTTGLNNILVPASDKTEKTENLPNYQVARKHHSLKTILKLNFMCQEITKRIM